MFGNDLTLLRGMGQVGYDPGDLTAMTSLKRYVAYSASLSKYYRDSTTLLIDAPHFQTPRSCTLLEYRPATRTMERTCDETRRRCREGYEYITIQSQHQTHNYLERGLLRPFDLPWGYIAWSQRQVEWNYNGDLCSYYNLLESIVFSEPDGVCSRFEELPKIKALAAWPHAHGDWKSKTYAIDLSQRIEFIAHEGYGINIIFEDLPGKSSAYLLGIMFWNWGRP